MSHSPCTIPDKHPDQVALTTLPMIINRNTATTAAQVNMRNQSLEPMAAARQRPWWASTIGSAPS